MRWRVGIGFVLVAGMAEAGGVALGVHAGTQGLGVEAVVATPTPAVNVRLAANRFRHGFESEEDDIRYDFDLQLESFAALLDLYPTGALRLSGGAYYNRNRIDAVAVSTATYEVGDHTYPGALIGTLEGTVDFPDLAPYAGIGIGNPVGGGRGLKFTFDVGVLRQGSPEASLRATGPIALVPQFQDDIAKEEAALNDDLKEYKWYPIVTLGVLFRF